MQQQGRRGRRRGEPRDARTVRSADARRIVRNPWGGARILSDDQVAHLHERALGVLQHSGLRVLLPEALDRFAAAGAVVDRDERLVRLDAELTAELIATAPSSFTIRARNPARDLELGTGRIHFLPVAGPPYASDRTRGRRPGSLADLEDLTRLTQHCDVLHGTCPSVEPQDVPVPVRHLPMARAALVLSDKASYFSARGTAQTEDVFEMVRIAHGIDRDTFESEPHVWTNINTNSPRQLDVPMARGIIDGARAGQAVIMTPFTLAGAMAPASLAGALVLQHAEAVAAIALAQAVRPGAPVVYGAFTSNVDMRSGAPAFGTPETVRAAIASGQLARHLGVPWRSQGASSSPTEDAQGASETMLSLMGCVLGGADLVIHSAGWQEGGLTASYEKLVLDVEVLGFLAESMQPIPFDDDELAGGAIATVAPGGHFFGADHTLARFETAFHEPLVFTRRTQPQWLEDGGADAAARAHQVWQEWLRDFEPPPIDAAVREELDEFVARRTAEGGAPPEQ